MTLGPQFGRFDRYIKKTTNTSDSQSYTGDSDVYGNHTYPGGGPTAYQKTINYPKETDKGYYYQSSPDYITALVEVDHRGRASENIMPKSPEGYTDEWADTHSTPSGQIPLFSHRETPGYSVLGYMNSMNNVRSRSAAMRLMGIAAIDAKASENQDLVPDTSLSPQSHGLVERLDRAGATEMPENVQPNTTPFMRRPESFDDHMDDISTFEPVPNENVGAAKGLLRSVLRGQRKPKPEPEYEQLQLDLD